MAELTAFGCHAGDSLPHRLDVRFKILSVILLSVVGLYLDLLGIGLLTILLLGLILHARLPLAAGLRQLRFFSILLVCIFVARALSTAGTSVFAYQFFTLSRQGLYEGLLVCGRLAFVVLLGFAFISTCRPSAIKAAVQWFLKPIPFIPERKTAVMMGLLLRFVPVVFEQAGEVAATQQARCVDNRRNPVYRPRKFGFPLLRRTFEGADNLVAAMEARCFTKNRTDPELGWHKRDWVSFCFLFCPFVAIETVIRFKKRDDAKHAAATSPLNPHRSKSRNRIMNATDLGNSKILNLLLKPAGVLTA